MAGASYWIALALENFGFSMFILALFFMVINVLVSQGRISGYEIVYRWLAFFVLGLTGLYAFIMHAFFPDLTAASIGWQNNPFQFEVAAANLGFGLIGSVSFNASYGFRLATVIGTTGWLWGDAVGHVHQMIVNNNFAPGNAGTWFWMDVIIPLILITCVIHLKRRERW